jgi:hypothetical protein
MERRDFIKKSALAGGALTATFTSTEKLQNPASREVYELRVYEMRWSQAPLDEYISKVYIPFLNRMGVKKVGAFSEIGKSEPVKMYLLIPYASFEEFGKISLAARNDKDLQQASSSYNKIPPEQAAFTRYESSLLLAFEGLPKLVSPAAGSKVFELRNYEGYSDDAVTRKVKMFNEGEFDIFKRTKLNSVFFGEVLAGKNLPCLTYMTAFQDMDERNRNWKAFLEDPEWLKISKDPMYANTVSKIYKTFLEPLPYSQV